MCFGQGSKPRKSVRNTGSGQFEFQAVLDRGGLPADFDKIMIKQVIEDLETDLALTPAESRTLRYFIDLTRGQDWHKGHRAIVWPSRLKHARACGITENTARRAVQGLIHNRLIIAKDSANMTRWGRRDAESGYILEAYGLDLSPLALRLSEFVERREALRQEERLFDAARRDLKATIVKIRDLDTDELVHELALEEYSELAKGAIEASERMHLLYSSAAMQQQAKQLADRLTRFMQTVRDRAGLAEKAKAQAEVIVQSIRRLSETRVDENFNDEFVPKGDEEGSPYDTPNNPYKDSVIALQEEVVAEVGEEEVAVIDGFRVRPKDLRHLLPIASQRLEAGYSWRNAAAIANEQAVDMGINPNIVARAMRPGSMGPHGATVAILMLASRPDIRNAGAYFNSMALKAERGELHLGKTLWGYKRAAITSKTSM